MDNANQTTESNINGTENAGQGSPAASSAGHLARWAKNSVYGFAGLTMLALVITVVSPEIAVAVSQYLPKEYQETIFASSASGGTCSAGMPVGGYSGSDPSMGSCCSAATSCCVPSTGLPVADESLAADIPNLSLDTMLAGLNDD